MGKRRLRMRESLNMTKVVIKQQHFITLKVSVPGKQDDLM